MKTYDAGAGTHGTNSAMKSLLQIAARWINRERELISLRNAVGMMSEARRADAYEYDQMCRALRKSQEDSRRLHWLTDDHSSQETREKVQNILSHMSVRSYSGTCIDIDAAMNNVTTN